MDPVSIRLDHYLKEHDVELELDDDETPPRLGGTAFWVVILLALVLWPLARSVWPIEHARWLAAQAMEADLAGDPLGALRHMEAAVQTAPDDPRLKLRLAEMLQDRGRAAEAILLCLELQNLDSSAAASTRAANAAHIGKRIMLCRIYSELQLQNFSVALDLTKQLEASSPTPFQTVDGLNLVAYVRALGNLEIDRASWAIRHILKNFQQLPNESLSQATDLRTRGLLAAAVLSRRFASQALLQNVLDEELDRAQSIAQRMESDLLGKAYETLARLSANGAWDLPEELELRLTAAVARQNLACLFLLRGLLREDLGQLESSQDDRRAAHRLGADEPDWLQNLFSDVQCLQLATEASSLLDTQACVQFRMARNKEDLEDVLRLLNLAIVADEICLAAWASDLPNQIQLENDLRVIQRDQRKGLAVKLRHRREVLTALKQFDLALADSDRIRALGFEQESILF